VGGEDSSEFNSACFLTGSVIEETGLIMDLCAWESQVTGMECAACAGSIEKAVKRLPGIEEATVAVLQNRAQVVYRPAFVQVCFCTSLSMSSVKKRCNFESSEGLGFKSHMGYVVQFRKRIFGRRLRMLGFRQRRSWMMPVSQAGASAGFASRA
jgi:hypothetical protein